MKRVSFGMLRHAWWLPILVLFARPVAAQTWAEVSGIQGQDIGIGKNGLIWATSKTGSIHRWDGQNWVAASGGASRVSVDHGGAAWVVNAGGQIYRWVAANNNWTLMPGGVRDIGVGADGTAWVIGTGAVPGGYEIYRWNGANWDKVEGGAVHIAVDPQGNAWVTNDTNAIFAYTGSGWIQRPGAGKDIGIGANGDVYVIGMDNRVYRWVNDNWQATNGTGQHIAVTPDGNPWVVRADGKIFRVGPAATAKVRPIFVRGQTYEHQILQALRVSPYWQNISLGGNTGIAFSRLDPFAQALGKLALEAAEIYYIENPTISADEVITQVRSSNGSKLQKEIANILGVLVMGEASKSGTDAQTRAIRDWAVKIYRGQKVRVAKGMLDELEKWEADFCTYEGLSAAECRVASQNMSNLFSARRPPQEKITNNAMKSVMAGNADETAIGIAFGAATVGIVASFAALTSSLTFGTFAAGSVAATGVVSLAKVFAGAAALSSTGWAGVAGGPLSVILIGAVVTTIEGFAVIEASRIKPAIYQELGKAMSDQINFANAMSDEKARQLFVIGFNETVANKFVVPDIKVDGRLRFFCQAGYVSRFRVEYTEGSTRKTQSTRHLPVGQEQTLIIPWNATQLNVIFAWFDGFNWVEQARESLSGPTYKCYTSFGTIVERRWKFDCPEISNVIGKANTLTLTHGGGYVAQWRLRYQQGGRTVERISPSNTTLGWRTEVEIPTDATNIQIEAWAATVVPTWTTIIDKTYPQPPNECIKVYGATWSPKWNGECQ